MSARPIIQYNSIVDTTRSNIWYLNQYEVCIAKNNYIYYSEINLQTVLFVFSKNWFIWSAWKQLSASKWGWRYYQIGHYNNDPLKVHPPAYIKKFESLWLLQRWKGTILSRWGGFSILISSLITAFFVNLLLIYILFLLISVYLEKIITSSSSILFCIPLKAN